MGFPRQKYWRGLPFPFAEALPHPSSPALAGGFFITEPPRKSQLLLRHVKFEMPIKHLSEDVVQAVMQKSEEETGAGSISLKDISS